LEAAEHRQLYETCYELLYQDEFQDWGWEATEMDGLVESYLQRVHEQGEPLESKDLRALLKTGVEQLVDAELRQRLAERLLRVAPLLRELYGGRPGSQVVWKWAVVAAEALPMPARAPRASACDEGPNAFPIQDSAHDEDPDEHPFLLGLVGHSLGQALDRDLDWTVAVSGFSRP
jgi:hypothetical protein